MTQLKVRAERIAWQHIDEDLIVLDENRSLYLRLRGSGAQLWPLVVDGTTVQALADELRSRYGIDAEQALADASAFARQLDEHELVDVGPNVGAGEEP